MLLLCDIARVSRVSGAAGLPSSSRSIEVKNRLEAQSPRAAGAGRGAAGAGRGALLRVGPGLRLALVSCQVSYQTRNLGSELTSQSALSDRPRELSFTS